MTFVQMRTDLLPLCQVHPAPMVSVVVWLKVASDVFPKPCYACAEAGCRYHYDIVHGYFKISEGESIERDMNYWNKCSREGLPMFIESFQTERDRRTWRCGQLGCAGRGITEIK